MAEEVLDAPEVLETPEAEEEQPEETLDEPDEDIEALRAKAAKADDLEQKNKQLFARLKKQDESVETPSTLSTKDVLALTGAGISVEDFDEVERVSKILGKPIHEALNDTTLKTILATRAEERRTAAATEIKSPRGTAKSTGEDLLRKAEKSGEVPDTTEGMKDLAKARLDRRRAS